MRLLLATPLYPPESGGPATYASILAAELPPKGIEVTLVKFSDVRLFPKVIRHVLYGIRVWKEALKSDLILALDPVSTGLPVALAARTSRTPYVVKVVGDYAWEQGVQRYNVTETIDEFQKKKPSSVFVSMLRAIQTWVVRQAKEVLVPSHYLKTIVAGWGVAASKITVIHNAIQDDSIGTVPESVQHLTHPYIVSAGRLVPWKHMEGVIDAASTLKLPLVIVGDGPEKESLMAYARKHASTVIFTGALPHKDLLAVMGSADVFVLNSSYEGLSHLLIEALYVGVPIVATDVGGNRELLTASQGALVPVSSGEALTEAIKESLLKERPEPERVRFSKEVMIENIVTFLQKMV